MKKALIIIAVVIVLIASGIYFVISRLDYLVARAIERSGSKATQTSVTVSGVDISLRKGTGSIDGLVVANPEGFGSPNAFSLNNITLNIEIGSLRKEPIVINMIKIAEPVVTAEISKDGSNNINVLRKRINEYAGNNSGKSEKSGKEEKRIRIKEFVFKKGRIELDATALGMKKKTIELPELRLTDIGGENGMLPSEVAGAVLAAFSKRAASAVVEAGVKGKIKDKIGGALEEKAKGLLEKVGN